MTRVPGLLLILIALLHPEPCIPPGPLSSRKYNSRTLAAVILLATNRPQYTIVNHMERIEDAWAAALQDLKFGHRKKTKEH